MKVAIVGGGVGGLTAAIALDRKGIAVDVYEQAPASAALGASLMLGPNALRLMGDLAILDALKDVGIRPETADFLRWEDGALLLRTPFGAHMEEHFGAPQLDFYRPDLHRVLTDALPPGAVHFGRRVTEISEGSDGVVLAFADGACAEADVVVGADGIHSSIRGRLFGDAPEYSGTVVYRGIAPRGRVVDVHPQGVDCYWVGPDRHAVCYWMSRGELLAVNCGARRADWSLASHTFEASADEVLEQFEGWDEPLLQRIRACDRMLCAAVFVRRPLERWSVGRVTLLGDAAHAMEPWQAQGAAQAVEDAYVLAECLAREPGDPEQALAVYAQIRMARAAELQSSSQQSAEVFYLSDGPEQQARDAAFATVHETLPFGPRQPIWAHDVRGAFSGYER
jgi:salicylate hydroxylase